MKNTKLGGIVLGLVCTCFMAGVNSPVFADDALTATPKKIAQGKDVFENHTCSSCHSIGEGVKTGPDLKGVLQRHKLAWLKKWIKAPDEVLASKDPIAAEFNKKMAKSEPGYTMAMPNLGLSDDDVDAVLAYIQSQSKK